MENWIRAKLFVTSLNERPNIINRFIGPCIKEIEKMNFLDTFHFFFYQDPNLHPEPFVDLRIKLADAGNEQRIKKIIETHVENIKEIKQRLEFDQYEGEIKNYGEEGWEIAKKLFECGSKYAIKHFDGKEKPKDLTIEKFIHCLFNPLFGYEGELMYHFQSFKGLMQYFEEQGLLVSLSLIRQNKTENA